MIKSTVERMMRLGASNSVRYAWNRWCQFVRTRLKEEAMRIKQAWAEDVRQKQEDSQEEIQRARQRMAAKRKSASELCLHQHWKRRVTRCFNLWVRWQTRRRRDAAEQTAIAARWTAAARRGSSGTRRTTRSGSARTKSTGSKATHAVRPTFPPPPFFRTHDFTT